MAQPLEHQQSEILPIFLPRNLHIKDKICATKTIHEYGPLHIGPVHTKGDGKSPVMYRIHLDTLGLIVMPSIGKYVRAVSFNIR